jgi:hypothetical protein
MSGHAAPLSLSLYFRMMLFANSLDKMGAGRCRLKPIGKILGFVGYPSVTYFHDAHRLRRYAVLGKYEFSDPEIAASDNSSDRKTFFVWLEKSALLNVVPASDSLARLRIIKYSILVINLMFELEIARVRSIPMAFQREPHRSIIHPNLLIRLRQCSGLLQKGGQIPASL